MGEEGEVAVMGWHDWNPFFLTARIEHVTTLLEQLLQSVPLVQPIDELVDIRMDRVHGGLGQARCARPGPSTGVEHDFE